MLLCRAKHNFSRKLIKYAEDRRPEKNGKEAPIWGVTQVGEMSHPSS